LSTGNIKHQTKIEAHILKYAKSKDKKLLKDKIKGKKHILVDGKVVEQDQDFLIVEEPFFVEELLY